MADEASSQAETPSEQELERRWATVAEDPDLEEDLGYVHQPLDVLVTSNNDQKLMLMPRDPESLKEDAYVVADSELGCDPLERA